MPTRKSVEPDANCITTADGGCAGGLSAGKERCMHDELDAPPTKRPCDWDRELVEKIAEAIEKDYMTSEPLVLPEARTAKVINDLLSERKALRAKVKRLEDKCRRLAQSQIRTVRSVEEFNTDD
jgi:hypothetical protein